MNLRPVHVLRLAGFLLMIASFQVRADEGMWVFNNLPLARIKAAHGFEPPAGWAEHLRSSAVRFNNGGSGSFVSADGLIMTNHHVGADTLAKLGTKDKDYYRDGFYARSYEEEAKSPDLELNVLVGIEDVTARVNAAVHARHGRRHGAEGRREGHGRDREGVDRQDGPAQRCCHALSRRPVPPLHVQEIYRCPAGLCSRVCSAFFGGDPDNFEYPRYDLDVCFFRAYENGKPASPPHHLKWSKNGSAEGDLIFVAGHPGRTDRLNTAGPVWSICATKAFPCMSRLACTPRKRSCSITASGAPRRSVRPRKISSASRTAARRGSGAWEGLRDPASWRARHRPRRSFASGSPPILQERRPMARPGTEIAEAQEGRAGRTAQAVQLPRTRACLRLATLPDCRAPASAWPTRRPSPTPIGSESIATRPCESLELQLFSEAPIYPEYEEAKLRQSLAYWKKHMPDHPLVERGARGRSRGGGRSRSGTRSQACRHRRAQEAGRRRQGTIEQLRRSDDQAGPGR